MATHGARAATGRQAAPRCAPYLREIPFLVTYRPTRPEGSAQRGLRPAQSIEPIPSRRGRPILDISHHQNLLLLFPIMGRSMGRQVGACLSVHITRSHLFNKAFFAGAFAEHFEGEGPKVIARVVLLPRVLGVNAWSRHLPRWRSGERLSRCRGHRTPHVGRRSTFARPS